VVNVRAPVCARSFGLPAIGMPRRMNKPQGHVQFPFAAAALTLLPIRQQHLRPWLDGWIPRDYLVQECAEACRRRASQTSVQKLWFFGS
jgi:hypothetical protein